MKSNIISSFFRNLSIKNDLPKLVFIILYLLILIINSLVFYSAEVHHRNIYKQFVREQLSQFEGFSDYENRGGLDQFTGMLANILPESEFVKNIVIIIWSKDGEVLWHSNKLIEKLVEKNDKKSNGIIKEMKFLDMPEIGFKPYEIFEKYSKNLKEIEIVSDFGKQKVLHFFSIPYEKNHIYVEVLREFKRVIPWKTVFYLQIGSLLITIIMTSGGYFFLKSFIKPVELFKTSMDRFINYNHPEIISYHSDNEIGDLVDSYNQFIQKASQWQNGIWDDTEGKNQKIIQYLQQKLTMKSIHKSDRFELLLFPKKSEGEFRKFVTVEENLNSSNLLFAHLDINNIESNIDKHIIQDKFHDIVLKSVDVETMNVELHRSLLDHSEIGPGYLFLNIADGRFSWVRSGPFTIYLLAIEKLESQLLPAGNSFMPSEVSELESIDMDNQNILVIADELLDYLNLDDQEFNDRIVKIAMNNSNSGKKLLLSLLNTINLENPDALKQYPMISIIRLK